MSSLGIPAELMHWKCIYTLPAAFAAWLPLARSTVSASNAKSKPHLLNVQEYHLES